MQSPWQQITLCWHEYELLPAKCQYNLIIKNCRGPWITVCMHILFLVKELNGVNVKQIRWTHGKSAILRRLFSIPSDILANHQTERFRDSIILPDLYFSIDSIESWRFKESNQREFVQIKDCVNCTKKIITNLGTAWWELSPCVHYLEIEQVQWRQWSR